VKYGPVEYEPAKHRALKNESAKRGQRNMHREEKYAAVKHAPVMYEPAKHYIEK
jgi:hypothetical protein